MCGDAEDGRSEFGAIGCREEGVTEIGEEVEEVSESRKDGFGEFAEGEDEKVIKKRKLEREKASKEGEDIFGPEIKKS